MKTQKKQTEKRFEKVIVDAYKVDNLTWVMWVSVLGEYVSLFLVENFVYAFLLVSIFGLSGLVAFFLIYSNEREKNVYYREIKQ